MNNIFQSARLKLTAFYFASLVVFCLLLTFGVRAFTEHELSRGDNARRSAIQQLFRQYDDQLPGTTDFLPPGDRYFTRTQQNQSNVTRQNLNRDFIILDLSLLALGALLSYWYAGRTLRPIEEAHEQQRRFTSDASHELRTPLTSMKLENEVFLRRKEFSEADARELIGSNLEEVNRLEKLATNLLALHSFEEGKVSHEPTLVEAMVDDAIQQAKKQKSARKVAFSKNLQAAKVDVNRESITQLLSILLENAVKYGGGGPVDITGTMHDERYALTVRDHGPGIAEEDMPHIFERMYRGDKARSSKVSGHGIGLSLAKQIADANESELTARNAEEGGAEFTLTIS
jgi:signal transduction histidine kinase